MGYQADIGIQPPPLMNHKVAALDATVTLPGRKQHQLLVGMDITLETTADGQSMNLHIGIGRTLFGNRYRIPFNLPAHAATNQELSAKFDGSLNGKPIVDNRQERFLSAQGSTPVGVSVSGSGASGSGRVRPSGAAVGKGFSSVFGGGGAASFSGTVRSTSKALSSRGRPSRL